MAFATHRAAHGHTPAERAAYEFGAKAGGEAPEGARLPYASDMNEMAQRAYNKEGAKAEPMTWKSAYGHGYEEGFRKSHPRS